MQLQQERKCLPIDNHYAVGRHTPGNGSPLGGAAAWLSKSLIAAIPLVGGILVVTMFALLDSPYAWASSVEQSLMQTTGRSDLAQTTAVTETTVFLPIIQTGPIPKVPEDSVLYVDVNGVDSAAVDGNRPLRTIQKAVSIASPGTTVYVRGGTYYEQVRIRTSGRAGKPITLAAYPGEEVIIDGQYSLPPMPRSGPVDCGETADSGCYNYGALVRIEGDYITVQGLDIRHSQGVGLLINGAKGVIVKDSKIHDIRFAPVRMKKVQDILFQNNDVWGGGNFAPYSRSMGDHMWPVAVFADNASHITYRGNRIFNNWGEGLSTGRTDAHHITIEDNIIYDNLSAQLYLHRAKNITAQRNFIYCSSDQTFWRNGMPSPAVSVNNESQFADRTKLAVSDVDFINNVVVGCGRNFAVWTTTPGPKNMRVANNTFVNAADVPGHNKDTLAIALLRTKYENVVFEKNIILQDTGIIAYVVGDGGLTVRNNLWSQQPPASASSNGDIVANPQLQNPNATLLPGQADINWFKLKGSSPAIANQIGPQEYLR